MVTECILKYFYDPTLSRSEEFGFVARKKWFTLYSVLKLYKCGIHLGTGSYSEILTEMEAELSSV